MKVYRSREGKIFGVCQGLADATGYPVRYWRIAVIAAAFFTGGWVLAAYAVSAILLPVKRAEGYHSKGIKENFEDLRDDGEAFVKREYTEFKDAGDEAFKVRKKRKTSESSEEGEIPIDPVKA